MNESLKFALRYKKGRQGDLNYEAVPLSPFLNPPIPSHVQRACNGASHCMRFMTKKLKQILKFMSEHITALNLVLNEVQPKFSSLLRRVSKVLKFANFFLSSQINVGQILKFHERVISALKFELSCKRSQILVVNSCE